MNWWILVAMMLVAILAVTWAVAADRHPEPEAEPEIEEGSTPDELE